MSCGLAAASQACLLLFLIRRLNETWFDPDWRAERDADRRRMLAWQQWDEELRTSKRFGEADNRSGNSFRP